MGLINGEDEKKPRHLKDKLRKSVGFLLAGVLLGLGASYGFDQYYTKKDNNDFPEDGNYNNTNTTTTTTTTTPPKETIKPCDEEVTYNYFNDTPFEREANMSLPVPYMYYAHNETVFANYTVGDYLENLKELWCNNARYPQDLVNKFLAKNGPIVYGMYALINEDFNTTEGVLSAGSGVGGWVYFKPVERDNGLDYLNITSGVSVGTHKYALDYGGEEYISFMLLNSNLFKESRVTNTTVSEYMSYYYNNRNMEYIIKPIDLLVFEEDTFDMTIINHISGILQARDINPRNLRESTLGDYFDQYNGSITKRNPLLESHLSQEISNVPAYPSSELGNYKNERIMDSSFLRDFFKKEIE